MTMLDKDAGLDKQVGLDTEAALPRAEIDRDYNARASVPLETFEAAMRDYRAGSDAARGVCPGHLDVVYDRQSGQTLDIYGLGDTPRPVFLFIHGGYWRALSKHDSAFMAGTLAAHGIATAVVDYRLAPEVDLHEIVREVRAAAAFLWHHGADHGLDPERIFVGGSSAGGHLTGALLSGGWHRQFGVPETLIKGALPISGLFHLGPIAHSFVREWLPLEDGDVASLSPALNLPASGCPIITAYAEGEPAGFERQSVGYHRLWQAAGFPSTLLKVAERNHFDVVLDLARDDTELTQALLALIGPNSTPAGA